MQLISLILNEVKEYLFEYIAEEYLLAARRAQRVRDSLAGLTKLPDFCGPNFFYFYFKWAHIYYHVGSTRKKRGFLWFQPEKKLF